MELEIMKRDTEAEVLALIETSTSHRGASRYEKKQEYGRTYVRASFSRNLEKNPYHEGTKVHTLLDRCLQQVMSNLTAYDLEDFPDEHLISMMILRLKREKKMNSTNLRQLLVPTLEHLDLYGIYVTEGILKAVYTRCPDLRVLSLMGCGYVVTDNVAILLLKKLPKLESVNFSECKHLTDRTVQAICKHDNTKQLNLTFTPNITEGALMTMIDSCPHLNHLDIFDKRISPEGRKLMVESARKKGLKIVLKGLSDKDIAPDNPCMMLPNFGKVW
ncbi:hypothetical protein ScPMuIL_006944 [Solemya velum]